MGREKPIWAWIAKVDNIVCFIHSKMPENDDENDSDGKNTSKSPPATWISVKGQTFIITFLFLFSPYSAPQKLTEMKNLISQFTITCFTCIARPCFPHCSWSCGRALAEISKKRKYAPWHGRSWLHWEKKTFGFSVVPSASVSLVIGFSGWQTNIFNLDVSIDVIF